MTSSIFCSAKARVGLTLVCVIAFWGNSGLAQEPTSPPAVTLQSILAVHRAWTTPPATLEITGTSMMGKTTQPIRIVATSKGENVTEFGSSRERKIVFTPNTAFEDDGTKVTKKMTAQRLSQLDVTGIYMLATGSMSETRLGQAAAASIRDTQALKVPVDRGRPPKQLAWPGETDSFDIYVGQNGLLLGIARLTTPEASSTRVTLGYTFTDYRLTNGVFLPYRIEAYLRGRLVETIEVEAYRFDIAVDPAVFKPGSAR